MDSHSPSGAPPHIAPAWRDDVRIAFTCLTRLPLPPPESMGSEAVTKALRLSPVVGAFVGALAGSMYWLWLVFGLSPFLAGLLSVLTSVLVTGAMHEKALCVMAEDIGGAEPRPDGTSQLNPLSVLALLFSLLLRAGAIAELGNPGRVFAALIAAGALSHAAMYAASALRPHTTKQPEPEHALAAAIIALLICLVALPFNVAIMAVLSAALSGGAMALIASRQGTAPPGVFGGIQQISEIGVLLALTAALSL